MPPSRAEDARPRILMVMTHCDMGGAEMITLRLVEGLAGAFRFDLFAVLDDNPHGAVRQNIAERCAATGCVITYGTGRRFKRGGVVEAAWRLARTIRVTRPAIVHLHCEIAELTYAVALWLDPRLRWQRVLRTVHNTVLWIDWHGIGRWTTRQLAHAQVVAVSHAAALADTSILGLAGAQPVEVIYNGVVPPPQRRLVTAESPFRLLFAGRFVAQKGADLLPAIFAQAAALLPGRTVRVTIAGQGVQEPDLVSAPVPEGWEIEFVPPIAELASQLRDFDGVIMPSRHEGFSLLAIEVLMAGVPLVATRAPGLDEVLPPDWPLAAEVEDVAALALRLAELIDSPAPFLTRAADLREEFIARWSEDTMLAAYAETYRVPPGNAATRQIHTTATRNARSE